MEVKINRMTWDSIKIMRDTIHAENFQSVGIRAVQHRFIVTLARAIDMEIRRKEFEGEDLTGSVFLSFDLKFVPDERVCFELQTSMRIFIQELDDIANRRKKMGG